MDGITTPRGFPNTSPVVPTANQVSRAAFTVEKTSTPNSEGFAVSFMAFAQFVDHDITDVEMNKCNYKNYGRYVKVYFLLFIDFLPEFCEKFKIFETELTLFSKVF